MNKPHRSGACSKNPETGLLLARTRPFTGLRQNAIEFAADDRLVQRFERRDQIFPLAHLDGALLALQGQGPVSIAGFEIVAALRGSPPSAGVKVMLSVPGPGTLKSVARY
jgi:hypothetical protein